MKKIFFSLCFICLVAQSFAQEKQVMIKTRFIQPKIITAAGLGIDFALGDFSETHSIGFSGSIGAYARINDEVRLGLAVDENYFIGKKIPNFDEHFEGLNILRFITRIIITNTQGTLIGTIEGGIANISAGGNNETGATFGAGIGVPLFGKTPLLGGLFRSKKHTAAKAELIIFLTPRLIPVDEE